MISTELLSIILNIKVLKVEIKGKFVHFYSNTQVSYCIFGSTYDSRYACYNQTMNIYELAHKCKEWALKNEHNLLSYLSDRNGIQESFVQLYNYKTFITTIHADTEPEAIFKACDYILKELSNK